MLRERDGSNKHSLSRCIFAGSWFIILAGAITYIWFGGPEVTGLAAALLTPAGAVYAAREHTKKQEAT